MFFRDLNARPTYLPLGNASASTKVTEEVVTRRKPSERQGSRISRVLVHNDHRLLSSSVLGGVDAQNVRVEFSAVDANTGAAKEGTRTAERANSGWIKQEEQPTHPL